MMVSLSSREHRTNLGKRKNGRCEEDITKVSWKGWEQRVRCSICYTHGGLSSALGYKLGEWWCADLRTSLGNFTLVINQLTSIPLLCNSAGKDTAVSRNSTRSHLPPGGNWVGYLSWCWCYRQFHFFGHFIRNDNEASFLMLGGHSLHSGRETHVYLLCAGALQGLRRNLSYLHHGILAPLWLWWQNIRQQMCFLQCLPVRTRVNPFLSWSFLYLLQMPGCFHNAFLTNCLWAYTGHFWCTTICARRWVFCILREDAKGLFLWSVSGILFVNFKDILLIFTSM